jgi:hypothetical protein
MRVMRQPPRGFALPPLAGAAATLGVQIGQQLTNAFELGHDVGVCSNPRHVCDRCMSQATETRYC